MCHRSAHWSENNARSFLPPAVGGFPVLPAGCKHIACDLFQKLPPPHYQVPRPVACIETPSVLLIPFSFRLSGLCVNQPAPLCTQRGSFSTDFASLVFLFRRPFVARTTPCPPHGFISFNYLIFLYSGLCSRPFSLL